MRRERNSIVAATKTIKGPGTSGPLRVVVLTRAVVLLALVATLAFPSPASAGVIILPIGNYQHVDLGDTTAVLLSPGELRVSTIGLEGSGRLRCRGDIECIEADLDGAVLQSRHDLQVSVDTEEGTIRGRIRGSLTTEGVESPFGFRGRIRGAASCVGDGPPACVLTVDVRAQARIFDDDGNRIGRLTLRLSGVLDAESASTLGWVSLTGDGRLRLEIPDPGQTG